MWSIHWSLQYSVKHNYRMLETLFQSGVHHTQQYSLQLNALSQPSECGRQRTLNIVHAQTAAQQQSIEVIKPGCPGNVESRETCLS